MTAWLFFCAADNVKTQVHVRIRLWSIYKDGCLPAAHRLEKYCVTVSANQSFILYEYIL